MKDAAPSLQENDFLKHFSPAGKIRLLQAADARTLKESAVLFNEGDPPDRIYLVIDGGVDIYKPLAGGQKAMIGAVGPGDYLGELGVLTDQPRSVSASASVETSVAGIPVTAVRETLNTEPVSTALSFLSRTVNYVHQSNERYTAEVPHKGKTELVGEMSGSIIHDLRNPIATVDVSVHLLSELHKDGPTKKACESIRRHTRRMTDMLQDLQDFSEGKMPLERKKTPLKPLLEELHQMNEQRAKNAAVRLSISAGDVSALIDSERLLRALENIISNSLLALDDQGGFIEMTATRDGDLAKILILDNGPGIPSTIRETIFEPFSSHWKRRRTGLGLAVVREIVAAHDGTVSIESGPENGALFKILLPASV